MNEQSYKMIMAEYGEKRRASDAAARANAARAMLIPEYAAAENEILSIREAMGRAALSGGIRPGEAAAQKQEIARQRERQRQALIANGMDPGCTEPQHGCPLCRDTGYIGTEKCACLQKRLIEEYYTHYNIPCDEMASFEHFDLSIFPDEPIHGGRSQRENMRIAQDYCIGYCRDFPNNQRTAMLLSGPAGRGKTFLLECIEKEVLKRGYVVFRTTAYNLGEVMLRHYIGEGSEDVGQEVLFSCDLLLIDDLGTEPLRRNVTSEAFYSLINERQFRKKGFIISTNLNAEGIRERYGERMLSRLVDRVNVAAIVFAGRDIRIAKR